MFATNRILTHFDPWELWNQLHHDLNQQSPELWASQHEVSAAPLNLWTSDDQALVCVELPGHEPGDIDVSVHRDVLTIEVKPLANDAPEQAKPGRRERSSRAVTRQVRLPFEVDSEQVNALCEKGLLTVTLNRHESTLPSKVEVKAG